MTLTKFILPVLALCLALYTLAPATPKVENSMGLFLNWMSRYAQNYSGSEIAYRHSVFRANLQLIAQHNLEASTGKHKYTLEANKFAATTDDQYVLLHTSPVFSLRGSSITYHCNGTVEDTPNPKDMIDWTKRASTDVQDEGKCASSWAFATTGALEGLYALDKSKPIKLSEQQLLDCSQAYGNQGCNGGLMDQAIWYVMDNGITTSDQYTYTGAVAKCVYKPTMQVYKVKDCAEVPSGNYSKLISAVNQQPVAVAISSADFKLYKEGVYDGNCTDSIDTGMLLLGYGATEDDGTMFWRLRSSMGTDWGINGTMLLLRKEEDGPGKCGVQLLGTVPRGTVA